MSKICNFTDCWWYESEAERDPTDTEQQGGCINPNGSEMSFRQLTADGKPNCYID